MDERASSAGARSAIRIGIALLLVAGIFDAEPLYVAGATFAALGLGCLAWVASGARGVAVSRSVVAPRVVEDDPLPVEIVLRATRAVLPTCVVEDPLLDEPVTVRGGRPAARVPVEARFPRRGRLRLPAPVVVVRDPLGLARRAVAGEGGDEILVLPRVHPLRSPENGGGQGAAGRRMHAGIAPAAEVDIDGLRPHREGAPASRIHWQTFARTGELVERRLRPEGDTRPVVVLDARGDDRAALDAAVRAAASLCVHLAERGGCSLLLPGERRPQPLEPGLSGWPHLHARLAVVDGGGAPTLAGLASRPGAIFYVAARVTNRVPAVLALASGAGRFLVVPGRIAGRRVAFEVAGCIGYDLAPGHPRRVAA